MGRLGLGISHIIPKGHHDAAWEQVKEIFEAPDTEVLETISGDDWIVYDTNKGRVELSFLPYVAPRIHPKEGA